MLGICGKSGGRIMSEETIDLINRLKAYLAVDRYGQDKVQTMRGYLLALQHQGLIDPWMAYDIITTYEKELANV